MSTPNPPPPPPGRATLALGQPVWRTVDESGGRRAVPATGGGRFERTVAPGVAERHARECGRGRGRRCSCTPTFRARVEAGGREGRRIFTETFDGLDAAVAWRETTRATVRAGGSLAAPRAPSPPLAAAARDFLRRARAGETLTRSGRPYAPATLDGYESALRLHLLELVDARSGLPLADLPVDAIDARTAQHAVRTIAASVSPARARQAGAALSSLLRDAYERGSRDEPAPRLILPPPPAGRDDYLTVEQADALLAAALADDEALRRSLMGPLVAVLLATGARISEALGLSWSDVRLDAGPTLTIRRATTKTNAGARVIAIEDEYARILRRHLLASGRPRADAPVFAREDGRRLDRHGRVRSGMRRVAAAAGLAPDAIGFRVAPHVLRHTGGTWLEQAGERPANIAARLGHTDPSFTARRYIHPDRGAGAETARRLADMRDAQRRGRL